MSRPDVEQVAIVAALTALAVATRDQTIDRAVFAVYLPHLAAYPMPVVLTACQRLQTADWFPKVGELTRACSAVVREQREARERQQLHAIRYADPASDAIAAEWLGRIRATVKGGH